MFIFMCYSPNGKLHFVIIGLACFWTDFGNGHGKNTFSRLRQYGNSLNCKTIVNGEGA